MGISAVGYLGGKVVRKPGPIIKTLAIGNVDEAEHTMTIPGDISDSSCQNPEAEATWPWIPCRNLGDYAFAFDRREEEPLRTFLTASSATRYFASIGATN